jgi:TonB family protein
MKRITHLALLVLFVFVIRGEAQTPPPPPPPPAPVDGIPAPPVKEWREFKYEPGNLVVIMPGEPVEMSQSIDSQIGKVPIKLFTAQMGLATYLAMYVEYPIVFDTPSAIKHSLESGRDLMLGKMGAKLISEKEVAYGKYPGREWNGGSAQFVIHSRAYIVNQCLYLFMAAMPTDEYKRLSETQSNDVVKFLDSFKLIKEPAPPPANAGSLARLEASAEKMVLPDGFLDRPTAWREFSSKEYGFNIQFPSEPFQQAMPLVPDNRRLDIQLWMAKGDDVVCQMLVQPMLTQPRDETQRNLLFKGLVAGIADDGEMKLLSEEPISFRGHPGRAYKFQMATGAVSGKAYIIGARVYLMLAILVGTNGGEKEASRFFDSFTPLDAPTTPSEPPSPPPPPTPTPPNPMPGKQGPREGTVKISGGPAVLDKAIKKVEPYYPPIAKAARVEGKVMVDITISAEGKVIKAEIIEGPPLLRDSVLQAVKQWEFKPTELSDSQVKVAGVLTFDFSLK